MVRLNYCKDKLLSLIIDTNERLKTDKFVMLVKVESGFGVLHTSQHTKTISTIFYICW